MRVQQELTLSRGVFSDSTDPMVSVLLDRIKKRQVQTDRWIELRGTAVALNEECGRDQMRIVEAVRAAYRVNSGEQKWGNFAVRKDF